VQYSTVQYSTVQYSTVQYSTVQYSTVQYNTIQYNTIQYSTVRYSTVQYSTVQYRTEQGQVPWLCSRAVAGFFKDSLTKYLHYDERSLEICSEFFEIIISRVFIEKNESGSSVIYADIPTHCPVRALGLLGQKL